MLSLKIDLWPRLAAWRKEASPEAISEDDLRQWHATRLELKRQQDDQVLKSVRYRHFI